MYRSCLPKRLQGKRILIVEDELLIAMEFEQNLIAAGALVVGPAGTSPKALDLLARERPDAAVLDLNLDGERPVALAQALVRQQVPFVVVTGYCNCDEAPFSLARQVKKPADASELIQALCQTMGLSPECDSSGIDEGADAIRLS